ncbi:dihydrodipicolinate synthase family protein [Pseudonocardia sp. CA-107938]|uniref:dihydrodipicolinate synthase family protein n=1 Tax=Pseudonocardia sp. CA-107938 TaxID=3240021 RepID=UPI003D8FE5D8
MADDRHHEFAARLASICAVPVTPMDAHREIDLASTRRLAEHVAGSRAGTITVGGSVAEFLALTARERLDVLAATVDAVAGRTPVLASVGGDLGSARQEARAAGAAGAAAVMVHQPLNPFRSPAGWVIYHAELAAAIAPLPVVLYLRDPAIEPAHLAELSARSPNLVGVKYALPDGLAAFTAAVGERVVWLCGLAERATPDAWAAGATGFTSGLVTVDDAAPAALLDALRAGDAAGVQAAWAAASPFEELRARRGGAASVGVVKTALVQRGVIADATVRPPLTPLDADEVALVQALATS